MTRPGRRRTGAEAARSERPSSVTDGGLGWAQRLIYQPTTRKADHKIADALERLLDEHAEGTSDKDDDDPDDGAAGVLLRRANRTLIVCRRTDVAIMESLLRDNGRDPADFAMERRWEACR